MHLNLVLSPSPDGRLDLDGCRRLVRRAEEERFDALVLTGDGPEPLTWLAAIAATTTHLGLIGAASTASYEPERLARLLASLDHLSEGRAGWQVLDEDDERAVEVVDVASGSPQGRPVLVHAPSSDEGRAFTARWAETVFSSQQTLGNARELYRDVKERARRLGRAPHQLKVLATVTPSGTPEQIADQMQDWYENAAADGFNVVPPPGAGGFDSFLDDVVPILRKRGLFRYEYGGPTLRDHLGLPHPDSRLAPQPLARRASA